MATSIAQLPPEYQKQVADKWAAEDRARAGEKKPTPKRNKYGNVRTPYKSIQGFERVYDSKAEAAQAAIYDHGIKAGLIEWWLPQVPFPLPGGVVYRADFLVRWANRVSVVDVKGKDTRESINKRKQVKALYSIDVELVKR